MKQSDQDIAKAILWSFEQLAEKFRELAAYEIAGVMNPSPVEWGIHSVLNKCAEAVEDTRKEIEKVIGDA